MPDRIDTLLAVIFGLIGLGLAILQVAS